MQISIRDAAGHVQAVQREVVEGRTVVRLRAGERLEVIDPATGRAPTGLRARRGGEHGQDLLVTDGQTVIEIEGFFGAGRRR